MGKILLLSALILLPTLTALSQDKSSSYPNYDLAPGVIPGSGFAAPTDDQWDLMYGYNELETQTGDNGLLGIAYDGTYIWISGRGTTANVNMFYLIDKQTGVLLDQFLTGTNSLWGIRDMCFDGEYICGGWEQGIYCYDITTHQAVDTIPIPTGMIFQRAVAYDPATDHFYCGNFASTCYEIDRNGTVIRSWSPSPLTTIYGMAWDDDAPDGPWLWVHDQTTPVSGSNIWQMDPLTLQYTGFHYTYCSPIGMEMAGGLEYSSDFTTYSTAMLVFNQGTPDAGVALEMYSILNLDLTPYGTPIVIPAGGGTFEFNISIQSHIPTADTVDVWTNVLLPTWTSYGPIINASVTLPPFSTLERDRVQNVPSSAPPGVYSYRAYIGDYLSTIYEMEYFYFTKSAADGGDGFDDWYCWGESFSGEALNEPDVPREFVLYPPYPNPFNQELVISFELSSASAYRLAVYDLQGREVSEFGFRISNLGLNKVVWDASGQASGVYFVKLIVDGRWSMVRKVVLMK